MKEHCSKILTKISCLTNLEHVLEGMSQGDKKILASSLQLAITANLHHMFCSQYDMLGQFNNDSNIDSSGANRFHALENLTTKQ